MKNLLIVLAFAGIVLSMGSALVLMMKGGQSEDSQRSKRMVTALAVRVGLSALLFVCILLAWKLGYIQPSGLPVQ